MPLNDKAAYNSYMRQYMLKRYHNRRASAIHKLGGKCVVCGTTENLELDHINPLDKSFAIGRLWSVKQSRYDEELSKCQLLCADHHKEKHGSVANVGIASGF